jgi:hypothetical protein
VHAKAASTARRNAIVVKWVAWVIAFSVLALAYGGIGPAKDAGARLDACVAAYGVSQEIPVQVQTAASQQSGDRNDALAAALLACSTQP